jgi:peptide chain release factor 1
LIEGDAAYSRMKFESGVNRVQRFPIPRPRENKYLTVTVAVLPEAEEVEVEIISGVLQLGHLSCQWRGGAAVLKPTAQFA